MKPGDVAAEETRRVHRAAQLQLHRHALVAHRLGLQVAPHRGQAARGELLAGDQGRVGHLRADPRVGGDGEGQAAAELAVEGELDEVGAGVGAGVGEGRVAAARPVQPGGEGEGDARARRGALRLKAVDDRGGPVIDHAAAVGRVGRAGRLRHVRAERQPVQEALVVEAEAERRTERPELGQLRDRPQADGVALAQHVCGAHRGDIAVGVVAVGQDRPRRAPDRREVGAGVDLAVRAVLGGHGVGGRDRVPRLPEVVVAGGRRQPQGRGVRAVVVRHLDGGVPGGGVGHLQIDVDGAWDAAGLEQRRDLAGGLAVQRVDLHLRRLKVGQRVFRQRGHALAHGLQRVVARAGDAQPPDGRLDHGEADHPVGGGLAWNLHHRGLEAPVAVRRLHRGAGAFDVRRTTVGAEIGIDGLFQLLGRQGRRALDVDRQDVEARLIDRGRGRGGLREGSPRHERHCPDEGPGQGQGRAKARPGEEAHRSGSPSRHVRPTPSAEPTGPHAQSQNRGLLIFGGDIYQACNMRQGVSIA